MSSELIAVLGALSGVLIGGLINFLASRKVKSHEWVLALARDRIASRQKLYAELLVEAQRLVVMAREEKVSSLSDFNVIGGKFAEVSLIAPDGVVNAAKKLIDAAITSNPTPPAKEVTEFFQLKEKFIAEARKDIASIESEV